jgi:eukaryotic-like serine/threonine-protein kinase
VIAAALFHPLPFMPDSTCPEKHVLLDFAAGRGEASLRSSVLGHLARCPLCRQVVSAAHESTDPQPETAPTPDEPLYVSGSHLGCDIAERELEDQSTALHSPEDVASRFDFRLLESPRRGEVIGHLGKYEVLQVLGYGGMGVVFRAQDEQLLRAVAIKVMSRELASSPTARRRFIREARAAAAINHPNVVTIHAVEEHNGTPFIVMEFIEGESLRDRLRHGPRLELIDVLRIAAQVASGLAAAHAHGVIHRDIKPGNIMLQDGLQRVKITDFGLARVAVDNIELTSRQMGVGTPSYMSPEQVRGDEIDARSDLFALGCVIFAMLRGHSPFHGRTTLEIARKVADGEPSPPVAEASVPPFLAEMVERLLQKSPDERYQSAGEVSEILRRHLALVNQTPTDKIGQVYHQHLPAPPRSNRMNPGLIAAIVAGVLALLAAAGWQLGLFSRRPLDQTASALLDTASGSQAAASTTAPRTLTVAKNGEADCTTISEALRQVTPNSTVTILDTDEYVEAIRLTDASRFSGVQLISPQGATLRSSDPGAAVVTVVGIAGLRLEGFTIVAPQGQVGIEINGSCPGLHLVNIKVERTANADGLSTSHAAVAIRNGATGTREQPIVVRRVSVRDTNVGVAIANPGAQDAASSHIVVEECQVLGLSREGSTLLAVLRRCEDIVIRRNIFAHGDTGLSLFTAEEAQIVRCQIHQNTWHDVERWINWVGPMTQPLSIELHHNLIVDAERIEPAARELATTASENAVFINNILMNPRSASESFAPLAIEMPDFPLLSQDANHPDYLKPDFARLKASSSKLDPIPGRYSAGDTP